MEKIYSQKKLGCKLVKVRPETVQFLVQYSQSLRIVEYKNLQFENNLN